MMRALGLAAASVVMAVGVAACDGGGDGPPITVSDDAISTPAGASSDSLLKRVAYFRELGFFAAWSALSDREVLGRIQRAHRAESRESIRADDPLADLDLVSADRRRAWWFDIEADALEGNRVYIETLRSWGRISRGWFRPHRIRESWGSIEGPVEINLELDGRPLAFRPAWIDAWIDLNLVCAINRELEGKPGRLEVFETFDQTAFVLALTAGERERLERERGWRFEDTCRRGWLRDFVKRFGP